MRETSESGHFTSPDSISYLRKKLYLPFICGRKGCGSEVTHYLDHEDDLHAPCPGCGFAWIPDDENIYKPPDDDIWAWMADIEKKRDA
jgi:hypothetical protein